MSRIASRLAEMEQREAGGGPILAGPECAPRATNMLTAAGDAMRIRIGHWQRQDADEHHHNEHEICAPGQHAAAMFSHRGARGEMQRVRLTERQICVIPAGLPHSVDCLGPVVLASIMVKPAFLQELSEERGTARHALAGQFALADHFLWHMVRSLEHQLQLWGDMEQAYLDALALVIGQHLLGNYCQLPAAPAAAPAQALPPHKMRRAIEYIERHYQDDIGFRAIADQLGMSPYHFARLFKQATGESPHQFIMRRRIEMAKKMLAESDRSVAEVAFEVGYKSQSYFTTRFTRYTGMPPAAYRAGCWSP